MLNTKKFLSLLSIAVTMVFCTQFVEAQKPSGGTMQMPPGSNMKKQAPQLNMEKLLGFIPKVVATFDGGKIMREDIRGQLTRAIQQEAMRTGKAPSPQAIRSVAIRLAKNQVDTQLLEMEAIKANIEITEEDIQEQIDQIKSRVGEERFKQGLKMQGMTMDKLKAEIKNDPRLLIDKWVQKQIMPKVSVTDEKLKEIYNNYQAKLSHILFQLDGDATKAEEKAAKEKAKSVRKEIVGGMEFAEAARKYSDGPSSSKGGDLGMVQRGRMVPSFEDAAFKLEEGEISQPVRTRFGYHLILGGAMKQMKEGDFKDSKESMKEEQKQLIAYKKVDEFLRKRRDEVNLEIKISNTAEGKEGKEETSEEKDKE